MNKKKILGAISFILICLLTLSLTCYAESNKSGAMVYASGEQLDQIYESFQSDSSDIKIMLETYSLTVVKESITPVYTLSLSEYAQSGKMNIVPLWCSHSGLESNGKGNVYVAKTLTSEKQYEGTLTFFVENGTAYFFMHTFSVNSPFWQDDFSDSASYAASPSYADHAKRISSALGETNLISAHDVKYVLIDSLGSFFYIKNNKHDRFFSTGYISASNSSTKPNGIVDYSIDATGELWNLANDYWAKEKAFLAEKAEWEAKHPGEVWDKTGGIGVSPIVSECSHVDNILDIASYLNIDYSINYSLPEYQELNNENVNDTDIHPIVDAGLVLGFVGAAIVIGFTVFIVVRKKRRTAIN